MKFWISVFIIHCAILHGLYAQDGKLYKSVVFKVDTNTFYSEKQTAKLQEKNYNYIKLSEQSDAVKVEIVMKDSSSIGRWQLKDNESIDFLDTVRYLPGKNTLVFEMRLKDNKMFFRGDLVLYSNLGANNLVNIPIFLSIETKLLPVAELYQLFQEEELALDIVCQNCWNIQADPTWFTNEICR